MRARTVVCSCMKVALTARFGPQMIVAIADISYHVFFLRSPLGQQPKMVRASLPAALRPEAEIQTAAQPILNFHLPAQFDDAVCRDAEEFGRVERQFGEQHEQSLEWKQPALAPAGDDLLAPDEK